VGTFGFDVPGNYPTYQRQYAVGWQVEPQIGVFLWQNWAVGLSGSYGRVHSNVLQWSPFYELGYFARFYIPIHRIPRRPGQQPIGGEFRTLPFLQLGHHFANTYVEQQTGNQIVHPRPDIQRLSPALGIDVRLRRNLYIEAAYRPQFYLNVSGQNNLQGGSLGLNYIVDPTERRRVMRSTMTGKNSRRLSFKYRAKKDSTKGFRPFKRLVIGTNLTYIPNIARFNGVDFPGRYFHELSWHVNAAVPILRRFRAGFNYIRVRTRDPFSGPDNAYLAGPFLQANLLPNTITNRSARQIVSRLYLELGGYKGNYCTCEPDNPFTRDDLNYISFGGGLDLRVTDWFHLDLGFTNFEILNGFPEKYNYTQYILGADFHISNYKKELETWH
ncbi:MAG: hypothetical protein AAF570_24665, partial [Bacteroidota bacterium]